MKYILDDTIIAPSTAPGMAAIAVVRLSGPEAINLVDRFFTGKSLKEQPTQTLHYGEIVNEEGNVLDEVVAGLFLAPHSYTTEDVVEISCHGSDYIIGKITELFIRNGARLAEPGEFSLRAFVHGRLDLSQAEAVADLVAAQSASAHSVALRQLRGGVSNEIKELRQRLLDFASLLELELDFSEEDVEFADREELESLIGQILEVLERLKESFLLGNALKNGIATVIAGRPNAGKSTLLNALLKEERAIVSEIAGTTRDTIEEVLHIKGVPFRLIDTAGIRDARDKIEEIGVARTLEKVKQSSVLIYVFDMTALSPEEVAADLEKLVRFPEKTIVVMNKIDLERVEKAKGYRQIIPQVSQFIPSSALRLTHMEELKAAIFTAGVGFETMPDNILISNARHYGSLQGTSVNLENALEGLASGLSADLVALDIRQALNDLGEITGEVTTEELLGNIFGRFCIGK